MHISAIEHLREDPRVKFKDEIVDGHSYTIVAYMIGDKDFWDDPAALETRGNAYDTETGECVCATFPKFFNVNERQDTQEHLIKDRFIECFEKRDGSMVTPILTKSGSVVFKTKKSFYSDVAKLANQVAPKEVIDVSRELLESGITPIWEFTHPDCRIVIDYDPRENFTLLAARDLKTGRFVRHPELILNFPEVKIIKRHSMTWGVIDQSIKNDVGIEGYVLLLDDGRRVKYKTHWYIALHHTMTELRVRDIAEAVVSETLDDIKSLVASQGKDIAPLEAIEDSVSQELQHLRNEVTVAAQPFIGSSFKDAAMALKGTPLFSLIMSQLRGKEPDYIDYWKRNFLKKYSLRCVFNANFGAQDEE